MNKHNTVLGQMLGLISRSRFEKLVKEHKTEHGAKKIDAVCHNAFQLANRTARAQKHGTGNEQPAGGWYHMGIKNNEREVKRSTLQYANAHRSAYLFKAVFSNLAIQAQAQLGSHGFRLKNPLYSIDLKTIDLYLKLFPWADFRLRGKSLFCGQAKEECRI